MHKIQEKIMQTNFAKRLKKLVILLVCVAVLGGGLSAVLLVPQIREAAVSARQWEQDRGSRREKDDGDSKHRDDKERQESDSGYRDDGEHDFLEYMTIAPSTPIALIIAGVTGFLIWVIMLLLWLLIAAWLYQTAVLSDMNGTLWLIAGLLGNVFAVVLFWLVRSFIRVKCPSCGSFQHIEARYCTRCGAALHESCESCGADCASGNKFCRSCGKKLHEKTV